MNGTVPAQITTTDLLSENFRRVKVGSAIHAPDLKMGANCVTLAAWTSANAR